MGTAVEILPDAIPVSVETPTERQRLELIEQLETRALALKGAGLGRSLLYSTIVEGLKATKDIYSTTGKVVASEPDHNVRAKFVASAIAVLGEAQKDEAGVKIGVINIKLPDGSRWR